MTNRADYAKVSPDVYKAFGGVYAAVQKSGLAKELIDLVYLRVSQSTAAPTASTCIRATC